MTHAECVAHGTEYVASKRGKPILGYALVEAQFVFDEGLSIMDAVPPPRHANILNWKEDLDAVKLQAHNIAEHATFVLV
jgi:hypothetical protein